MMIKLFKKCAYPNRFGTKLLLIMKLNLLLLLFCSLQLQASPASTLAGNNDGTVAAETSNQQQQRITGVVTDASTGEFLPGVTVQVKGTTTGAITGTDGMYTVTAPPDATALVFSFVGMETREIEIAGRSVIDVALSEMATALEEVVVTGYATERKKDIVGSVSVVSTDDMNSTASAGLTSKLQGRAAGVTVSGISENGSAKIRIRGFGSFTNSEPLYIIDGMPGNGDLLNPDDIESVQVLKDAASASIYGARGANGVIIVTTKKGQAGRTRVEYDGYVGMNYANRFPELLNNQELADLFWMSYEGAGLSAWEHPQYGSGPSPVIPEYALVTDGSINYGGAALEAMRTSDPTGFASLTNPDNYDKFDHQIVKTGDTDWYSEAFRQALIQNHQLTVSGGNENGLFALSFNYFDQQTTTLYGYNKRFTLRANSSFTIKDVIRVGENLQLQFSTGKNGVNATTLYYMMPYQPVKDIMGNWVGMKVPGTKTNFSNPIADASRQDLNRNKNYGVFGNVFAEVDLFKDLTLRSSIGINFSTNFTRNFGEITYENTNNTEYNRLTYSSGQGVSWTWTNQATYAKTIGQHSVRLMAGSEAMRQLSENVSGTAYDFLIGDDINYLILDQGQNANSVESTTGSWGQSALMSYFGRLDYNYADKYLFNATIRHDGSNVFTDKYKWGTFPAIGLGWRVSSENFMQGLTWLTDLKLRGSWGIIGNSAGLPNDNQYTTFNANTGAYSDGTASGYLNSYTPSTIGNPNAKWEETRTVNIGFDASLLAQRLDISAEWFSKTTDGLLVQKNAPYTGSTADNSYINLGSVKNVGVEATVTTRGNIIADLRYEATVTFTTYKNEVLKIFENDNAAFSSNDLLGQQLSRSIKGDELAYYYGYVLDGFYNTQAEVDADAALETYMTPRLGGWKVKDVNKDGKIDDEDKTKIGSPHPDFQMGLNLNLAYRSFDLNAFFFWQQGGDKIYALTWYTDQINGEYNKSKTMLYDSWTDSNKDAKLPKVSFNDDVSFKYFNDYMVQDVSFFRLRTLQVGYTVPQSLISKVGLDRVRIYLQASNLFTITKYTGLEPDGSLSGTDDLAMGRDDGTTPVPKQLIFGLNLGF